MKRRYLLLILLVLIGVALYFLNDDAHDFIDRVRQSKDAGWVAFFGLLIGLLIRKK